MVFIAVAPVTSELLPTLAHQNNLYTADKAFGAAQQDLGERVVDDRTQNSRFLFPDRLYRMCGTPFSPRFPVSFGLNNNKARRFEIIDTDY